MAKPGLKRRIHFYSTEVTEISSKGDESLGQPSAVMRHMDAVVSKKDWQRQLNDKSRSQGILCRTLRDHSLQGQFWVDKHDDFPLLGEGQSSSTLETNGKPLRYPSHFVWWDLSGFPEIAGVPRNPTGLLVMERSQQGPRSNALEDFLNSKSAGKYRVKIDPLLSAQALERLQSSKMIKKVRARVEDENAVRALEQSDNLAGLYVASGIQGIQEFEWSVKAGGTSRLHVLKNFLPLLKKSQDATETPINIWITFDDDLELPLEEAAIQHIVKSIPRESPTSHSVRSSAMWDEIRSAFKVKRSELEKFFGRKLG